jgi:surface carbohydrate biosynthesis protein (TIGR04326 family)
VTYKPINNILIWDSEYPHPSGETVAVLWRSFVSHESPNVVSIPQLIEDNAEELRARYLAWVYDLGELCFQSYRIVDHLQIHPNFSYWWMTLLAEKCNYEKSPQINDAIRIFAFTDWAANYSITHITLSSANAHLAQCLQRWCKKSGVKFKWHRLSPILQVPLSNPYLAIASLPFVIKAWAWLIKYLFERWSLKGVGLQNWQQTSGSVTFVSYLEYLKPDAINKVGCESRYWGPLPKVLQHEGYKTNWLHLYEKNSLLPNAKTAAYIIHALNKSSRGIEIHVTLDSFLNFNVVRKAIQDWLKLSIKGKKLQAAIAAFSNQATVDLWPLFSVDWRESSRGITSMKNALLHNLFDNALNLLPKQNICCYLQENQGWEFSLIQNWKIIHQGQLIGVPHSTVRFWDLRYFFDRRYFHLNKSHHIPLPDLVALNGQAAMDVFLSSGYPIEDLVKVEALRFLYLNNAVAFTKHKSINVKKKLRLLVLGDYLESNTRLQMSMLAQAARALPTQICITFKPHPQSTWRAEEYPDLHLSVANKPLVELLTTCDIAYTSSVTSAAIDAYCLDIPVISVKDPTKLNMSPLRGFPEVFYVSTSDELIGVFQSLQTFQSTHSKKKAVFNLDRTLPQWRKLLNIDY